MTRIELQRVREPAGFTGRCGGALDSVASRWHQDGLSGGGRAPMKTFLLRFFTWWNGQTFGTQLSTRLHGELVGLDEFGNRYYRTRHGRIDPALGIERRWVIYNGVAEASAVPPSWHGWLHHIIDAPPTEEKARQYPWEKPHRPNPTGTPSAQRPRGSTLAEARRPKATGDYHAWTPEN
jgi:NADH:ubiquinone oxidoreductase subunit